MLITQKFHGAQSNPGAPAIRYLGKDFTYGEVRKKIAQLSYLYQNEIGAESPRVGLLSSNCPAVATTFLALTNIRAVTIPIDPQAPFEQQAAWLRAAGATHLAVSSDLLHQARELLRNERLSLPIIEIEKKKGGEYDTSFIPPSENPPADTDLVLLLRTGGATATAKLAAFDHPRIQHGATALRSLYRAAATDRVLCTINWSHPFAFVHGLLYPLLTGSSIAIDHGVPLEEYVKFLAESRVTRIVTEPLFALQFLRALRDRGQKIASVKSLVVGLAGLAPPNRELVALAEACETSIVPVYGQTENGWTIAMDGKPLSGLKYKVIDAEGDEITGKGTRTGQLCVSGPTVMVGYRGPEEEKKDLDKATKSAIRGTWLYTGDIARITDTDEGIAIELIGRKCELAQPRPGHFVHPGAMDEALRSLAGAVDGAGFVGLTLGKKQILACAVVKAENSLLKERDVLLHLKRQGLGEHMPVAVAFADSIPRLKGGDPNRFRLQRMFEGIAEAEFALAEGDAEAALPAETELPAEAAPPAEPEIPPVMVRDLERPPEPEPEPRLEPEPEPRPRREPTPAYITFEIEQLLVGEPLPVAIYTFLQFRFVPFRPRGSVIDQYIYDRLDFKGIRQLFVLQDELDVLLKWHDEGLKLLNAGVGAPDPGFERMRADVRERTQGVFQDPHPDKAVAKLLVAGKKVVDEVIKSPYTLNPLRQLQAYSKGTVDHSVNVSILSTYLALQMGYSHALILQHVAAGGLLHDIGKALIKIEDEDDEETGQAKLKEHPLRAIEALEKEQRVPNEVKMIIAQHHECHDGSGYPRKLKGSGIYDLAQIVAIANRFEDLVAEGRGSLAERQKAAITELGERLAHQFNPQKLGRALKILTLGV